MVKVILLIGVQGSGKSWTFQELIRKHNVSIKQKIGKIRFHTNGKLFIAGVYNGEMFQGSDKLSMSAISDYDMLLSYITGINHFTNQPVLLLLEGDRFTNSRVIEHKEFKPHIIKITNDGAEGRKKRGSEQSEDTLKRMRTRIANISPDQEVKHSENALEAIEQLMDEWYGE